MANVNTNEISNPSHYTEGRVYEPKDVIRKLNLNFNLGNVVKYISRAGRKENQSKEKDLRKAHAYLGFEIDYLKKNPILPAIADGKYGHKEEINYEEIRKDWDLPSGEMIIIEHVATHRYNWAELEFANNLLESIIRSESRNNPNKFAMDMFEESIKEEEEQSFSISDSIDDIIDDIFISLLPEKDKEYHKNMLTEFNIVKKALKNISDVKDEHSVENIKKNAESIDKALESINKMIELDKNKGDKEEQIKILENIKDDLEGMKQLGNLIIMMEGLG